MEKINNLIDLKARITYLETERQGRELALKKELQAAHEFLKPANLVSHAVKGIFSSKEVKNNLFDGLLGMASGYFAKKAVTGSSKNPLKAILGSILQLVVTGQVAGRAEPVRTAIMNFISEFLNKKENPAT
jgi:hypothetical protein